MNSSNPQTDDSTDKYDQFLATLDERTVCPYCGDDVDRDMPNCCSEIHSEIVYDNGEETLSEGDGSLEKAFTKWLAANEADIATGAKYEK